MNTSHDRNVERIREHVTSTTADTQARLEDARRVDADRAGTWLAGARVLDLVTGLEGIVGPQAGTTTARSALVAVRLDRGDLVLRPASQLLERPTPPRA